MKKKIWLLLPLIVICLIVASYMEDDKLICTLETKDGSMKNTTNLTFEFLGKQLSTLEKVTTRELESEESLQEAYKNLVTFKEENEEKGIRIFITKNVNNISHTIAVDYKTANEESLKELDIEITNNNQEKKIIKRELNKKYRCYYK